MKSDLALCRLCLEPIVNPLCTNCLSSSMAKWLKAEGISPKAFREVHSQMMQLVDETLDNVESCIRCKEETLRVICPYCYVREVYQAMKRKDWLKAEKMKLLFNFDFEGAGYDERIHTENLEPIREEFPRGDPIFEVCEMCGTPSDSISEEDGRLVCMECVDLQ